ncbi:MAG: nitrous oxide-stimulated promoter family protein [Firmicutes bacterium]|nr:nitrous oxide-stimulated promoter family protein [Bacillota bacterium]
MAFSKGLEEKTVRKMMEIYCHENHGTCKSELCTVCSSLLEYSIERINKCPFGEQKPVCAKCTVHCYQANKRDEIKQVMRYAGPRMLAKSPILTLRYLYRKVKMAKRINTTLNKE